LKLRRTTRTYRDRDDYARKTALFLKTDTVPQKLVEDPEGIFCPLLLLALLT
jgi:hypothetical protein